MIAIFMSIPLLELLILMSSECCLQYCWSTAISLVSRFDVHQEAACTGIDTLSACCILGMLAVGPWRWSWYSSDIYPPNVVLQHGDMSLLLLHPNMSMTIAVGPGQHWLIGTL